MLGDVKFIKFYPLTTVWERNNFLKQEDVELFSHVGDGAKMQHTEQVGVSHFSSVPKWGYIHTPTPRQSDVANKRVFAVHLFVSTLLCKVHNAGGRKNTLFKWSG